MKFGRHVIRQFLEQRDARDERMALRRLGQLIASGEVDVPHVNGRELDEYRREWIAGVGLRRVRAAVTR